ncbi:hypothetical protein NFI95_09560 [Acetobacteraceae bacterium KSS8]|uniref:SpoVT-AbrB domain-containing protein n=1 Tax=Endosaccharibacter trunci TaxID=2812733 RepID=A0ABT1W744_9PROT|nr:hypothetical protein [Acetobacteraceae bacterium KSS8]
MAEQIDMRLGSGTIRLPAEFRGTARLLGPGETPSPQRPMRHGDLEGRFEADIELSFSFLLGLGFEPVHPTHPSYPAYLSAVREEAPPPEPALSAVDPHDPDLILMPFETVVPLSDEIGLRFGLVPPGHAATRAPAGAHGRPMRRKPIPPP